MSLRSGLRPTQTAWIAGWAFSPAYPKGRLSLEMGALRGDSKKEPGVDRDVNARFFEIRRARRLAVFVGWPRNPGRLLHPVPRHDLEQRGSRYKRLVVSSLLCLSQ